MYFRLIILLAFLSCKGLYAQKEAWNWFLSDSIGLKWENGVNPVYTDIYKLKGEEGSGAISDKNGNLLYYTNGTNLYNASGTKLNKTFGLMGLPSSTQGKLFVKHEQSDTYYLFTNGYKYLNYAPLYCTSFMPSGDSVIFFWKAKIINEQASEGLGAIKHQNQRDVILVTHSLYNDSLFFYLITKNGLHPCKRITKGWGVYEMVNAGYSTINVSPTGRYISISGGTTKNMIENYALNTQTCQLTNKIAWSNHGYFPLTFSANDSFAYYNSNYGSHIVSQLDISKWDITSILNSENIIYQDLNNATSCIRNAPNGQILITREDKKWVSLIKNANKPYPDCDFVNRAVIFSQGKCRFGNFSANQSYFYTPAINYKYQQSCDSNVFQFEGVDTFNATSYKWVIYKGTTSHSYNVQSPKHYFEDTGNWKVKYIAKNGSRTDSVIKIITIFKTYPRGFLGGRLLVNIAKPLPVLSAPANMNCYTWQTPKRVITDTNAISIDTSGRYILEMCSPVFCNYKDTLEVIFCDSLPKPSITRNRDSLKLVNNFKYNKIQWKRKYFGTVAADTSKIFVAKTGQYYCVVSTPQGCTDSSSDFAVNFLYAGTRNPAQANGQYKIVPNPNNGTFRIEATEPVKCIKIYDNAGKLVFEGNQNRIENLNLVSGVYLVRINDYFTDKLILGR